MAERQIRITDPLVLVFREPDGNVVTHIHRAPGIGYESFGLLVCDLVRHVAGAFEVSEEDVWNWVDKERRRPTTEIARPV